MFICTGNICRSPLAHEMFQHKVNESGVSSEFFLESSGTDAYHNGENPDSRMCQVAARHGLHISHRSRRLKASDLNDYDLLLTMDNQNYRNTIALAKNDRERKKVKMFRDFDPNGGGEVPDPWYGGMAGFDLVWEIVERTCDALLEHLKKNF